MPIYKGSTEVTSGNLYKGSTNIEEGYKGTNQSLTITNNQAVRLVYVNATFGWLIT